MEARQELLLRSRQQEKDNYGLRTTVDTNKHPVVEQLTQLGLGGSKDLDFKTMRPTLQ